MPPIHLPKRQAPAPGRWWSLQYVRPYMLAVFFVAVATLARWLTAMLFLPPVAGGGASGLLSLIGLALFIAIGLGTGIVGESRLQAVRQTLDQHGAAGAAASA